MFVDGRFRDDLSSSPDTLQLHAFAARPPSAPCPARSEQPVVALNTMLAEDGAVLSVAAGVDAGTLLLVNLAAEAEGRSIAFHPRHAIRLAGGRG